MLPATEAGGPYTITATSQKHGSATLQDVLFGDVWICSGQSNMHFTVPMVRFLLIVASNSSFYCCNYFHNCRHSMLLWRYTELINTPISDYSLQT